MPSRSRVRMIRTAISPRLAIRTLLKLFAGTGASHPEDAVAGRLERGVGGRGQREPEDPAGAGRVDDPVVPQPGGRVVRVALVLVLLADVGLVTADATTDATTDGGQHARGLVAAHDGDAGVRPHPQKSWRVGAAAHRVIARAERAADDHRELRDSRAGDGGDHLGAVLSDAARLVLPAEHEAGDVLQEDQGNPALVTQLDEVGALERGLAEQDAVVGDDADGVAVDAGEA